MIKATAKEFGRLIILRLDGHANYAPNGTDIVCSAVSILTSSVCNLIPSNRCRMRPGGAVIAFSKYSQTERDYLRMAAVGLAQLAKTYPDHVRFDDRANALSYIQRSR